MKKQYIDLMQKMLENEHAEPAPPLKKHTVKNTGTYRHSAYITLRNLTS